MIIQNFISLAAWCVGEIPVASPTGRPLVSLSSRTKFAPIASHMPMQRGYDVLLGDLGKRVARRHDLSQGEVRTFACAHNPTSSKVAVIPSSSSPRILTMPVFNDSLFGSALASLEQA